MFVAGIYRVSKKSLPDFTQFMTGTLEYAYNYFTVFTCNFNVDIMNDSDMSRDYIDEFHQ